MLSLGNQREMFDTSSPAQRERDHRGSCMYYNGLIGTRRKELVPSTWVYTTSFRTDGKYYGRIYRFAAGRVTRVSNILIPGILDTFPFHLIRHERVFFFLLLVLRDPSVRILMAVGPNRRCRLHDCGSNGYRFRLASPATVDTSPTPESFSETPTAILFVRRQFHPQQQQQLVRVTIKETYVLLSYIDSLRVKSLL